MIGVIYMAETLGLMNSKGINVEHIVKSGVVKTYKEISYLLIE